MTGAGGFTCSFRTRGMKVFSPSEFWHSAEQGTWTSDDASESLVCRAARNIQNTEDLRSFSRQKTKENCFQVRSCNGSEDGAEAAEPGRRPTVPCQWMHSSAYGLKFE